MRTTKCALFFTVPICARSARCSRSDPCLACVEACFLEGTHRATLYYVQQNRDGDCIACFVKTRVAVFLTASSLRKGASENNPNNNLHAYFELGWKRGTTQAVRSRFSYPATQVIQDFLIESLLWKSILPRKPRTLPRMFRTTNVRFLSQNVNHGQPLRIMKNRVY